MSAAGFDFAPAARLLLVFMAVALLPLCVWLWRQRNAQGAVSRHRSLALLVLFLTFDLVVFGAFTRLSDSGLGCPDWPGCYGHSSPLEAASHIDAAQQALPSGPVTHGKAWIEMVHRYWAGAVGALILLLTVSAWRLGQPALRWTALATLVWVCLQGLFGALTVTMKLFPAIVTLHLLGGLALLVLLLAQVRQAALAAGRVEDEVPVGSGVRALASLAAVALAVQIGLGGWVSTNYAVLACQDFPTCQGSFWPPMNAAQGFTLWRPLGQTAQGEPIAFQALTAIHVVHRGMAVVAAALLLLLAWRLTRAVHASGAKPSRATQALAALVFLQVATGLSNVVLGWPLLAALLHTAGAAALTVVMAWILMGLRT